MMNTTKAKAPFSLTKLLLGLLALVSLQLCFNGDSGGGVWGHESTFGLHGSGTTNPSRCYWTILDTLREQTIIPLHVTYRGIGSTNGMNEFAFPFLNTTYANDETYPNFFGSGDIPITKEIYDKIIASTTTTGPLVHIPVMAGTVSFFYHIPNLTTSSSSSSSTVVTNLNLTACVLSQIYLQKITVWNDPAILAINPELDPDTTMPIPITVIRRSEGSSSTHAATNYMHTACKDSTLALPEELTGELPDWAEPTETFQNCSGSAGVTTCLLDSAGGIGYIDTGHGLDAGLAEVRLQSTYDPNIFFHSSDGTPIGNAINASLIPSDPTADFSNVSFLNIGDAKTWPLILMTYIYVRTDLPSLMMQPYEQTLLVAFLKSFFIPDYVNVCSKLYGFTVMNDIPSMKEYGEAAIALVEQSINSTATPPWTFELKTIPIGGAGPYVFSTKRKEIIDVTVQDLTTAVTNIETALITRVDSDMETIMKINALQKQVETILLDIALLQTEITKTSEQSQSSSSPFTDQDSSQIKAALALSSLSFIFWCMWMGVYVMRQMNRSTTTTMATQSATSEAESAI